MRDGNPAWSVLGALSDHHRLMRQFGAVPLMLITCLAIRDHHHDREDPHRTGLPIDPYKTIDQPPTGGARNVRAHKYFFQGLEIPMAVTECTLQLPFPASVVNIVPSKAWERGMRCKETTLKVV